MIDTTANLNKRKIAWEAQTLFERGQLCEDSPGNMNHDNKDINNFISDWKNIFDGSSVTFKRRLAFEGISPSTCVDCLQRDRWPKSEPLPKWITIISNLLSFVDQSNHEDSDTSGKYPFEQIITPWVAFAHNRWSEPNNLFTTTAMKSLMNWLQKRLVELSSEALFVDFKYFLSDSSRDVTTTKTKDTYYNKFVRRLHSGNGLSSLFAAYPVLARFVGETIRQWIAVVEELEHRIASDTDQIHEKFGGDKPPDSVADVEVLAGDQHAKGRVVMKVKFNSNLSVIYKPRSLAPEQCVNSLLETIHKQTSLDFKTVACLDQGDYGWMEWIPHEGCSTEKEIYRYYQRAGGLLALAYAMRLTDCHFENIVASGEYPILVDAETIMQPKLSELSEEPWEAIPANTRARSTSVLQTGLLPIDSTGEANYRIGGLTSEKARYRAKRHEQKSWSEPNTDVMEYHRKRYSVESGANLPTIDDESEPFAAHMDAVENGFRMIYRYLMERGSNLLSTLEDSSNQMSIRIIIGSSRAYSSMIRAITAADCLMNGLKLTKKLENPNLNLLPENRYSSLQVHKWERKSLMMIDIPRFTIHLDGKRLWYMSNSTEGVIERSGYKMTRNRLSNLDESDMLEQLEHIKSTISSESPQ